MLDKCWINAYISTNGKDPGSIEKNMNNMNMLDDLMSKNYFEIQIIKQIENHALIFLKIYILCFIYCN